MTRCINRLTISVLSAVLFGGLMGGLAGCTQTQKNPAPQANGAPAQPNAPVWMGGYQGQIALTAGKAKPIALWLSPQGGYRMDVGGWGSGLAQEFSGRIQWQSGHRLNLVGAPEPLAHWQVSEGQLTTADNQNTLAQTPPLVGVLALPTEWALIDLPGTPTDAHLKPPTLRFSLTQQVAGFDGCNRLMGAYTLAGQNGLHFTPLASTQMACATVTDDAAFRALLAQVASARLSNEQLIFQNAAGQEIAQFRAVNSQALPSSSRKNSASRPE
ncbi:MAG TPA: META domain-containing protein [Halothiobacillus sp.]|nr:META domain-containing protein [Halothiobacillus sp.]HQS30045.1 META domain-containing protein [Halothiobacillus sp.]HUN00579.1 META domain-containing protein [Halothiobacillus sp.]